MTEKKGVTPKKGTKLKSMLATVFILTAAAGSGGCQAPMPSSF